MSHRFQVKDFDAPNDEAKIQSNLRAMMKSLANLSII